MPNNSLATTAQIDELNASIQAVYTFINSQLSGKLFTFGPATPPAANQNLPWIRTDASQNIIGTYTFNAASQLWVTPNPAPPSSNERRFWIGTESALWSYDGGDGTDPAATVPTATTGAMWQVDHSADFRFPIGPGAGTSITVGVGQTGGEELHVLTPPEGAQDPAHAHVAGRMASAAGSGSDDSYFPDSTGTATGNAIGTLGVSNTPQPAALSSLTGPFFQTAGVVSPNTVVGHNNIPPYIGMYVIQRTARVYYTVVG